MSHIGVIGAGTGSVPAAYELRNRLGAGHKLTQRYILKALGIERAVS